MSNKSVIALAAALTMLGSTAFAADTNSAPLAPGGAAGIQTAQSWVADNTTWVVVGLAVVVLGVVLIAGDNGNHHHTVAPPTSGTP